MGFNYLIWIIGEHLGPQSRAKRTTYIWLWKIVAMTIVDRF